MYCWVLPLDNQKYAWGYQPRISLSRSNCSRWLRGRRETNASDKKRNPIGQEIINDRDKAIVSWVYTVRASATVPRTCFSR
jgi:hypothetical protein